jgi:hypothetical protein
VRVGRSGARGASGSNVRRLMASGAMCGVVARRRTARSHSTATTERSEYPRLRLPDHTKESPEWVIMDLDMLRARFVGQFP